MIISNSMELDIERDVILLTDRVIIVTRERPQATTVERLAQKSQRISPRVLQRTRHKSAETVINMIHGIVPESDLTFVQLDQADLASVKAALEKDFKHDRFDLLICDAGIMAQLPGTSVQSAINHLSHALIIKKLLPTLLRTAELPGADVRAVCLTSLGWHGHPSGGIRFETPKTGQDFGFVGPWRIYGQSKLADIVYAADLARRYPQVTAVSIHPEVLRTDLVQTQPFMHKAVTVLSLWKLESLDDGTLNALWAAAGATRSEIRTGLGLNKDARSTELAERLWDYTEEASHGFCCWERAWRTWGDEHSLTSCSCSFDGIPPG